MHLCMCVSVHYTCVPVCMYVHVCASMHFVFVNFVYMHTYVGKQLWNMWQCGEELFYSRVIAGHINYLIGVQCLQLTWSCQPYLYLQETPSVLLLLLKHTHYIWSQVNECIASALVSHKHVPVYTMTLPCNLSSWACQCWWYGLLASRPCFSGRVFIRKIWDRWCSWPS